MRAADAALLIFALMLMWSFYRAQKDPATSFDLFDLIRENGRLSKIAVAFMVLLGASSWIMIRLTLDGKLSEGYFALYGTMWVGPVIAKMFSAPPPPSSSTTTTTTSTAQEIK